MVPTLKFHRLPAFLFAVCLSTSGVAEPSDPLCSMSGRMSDLEFTAAGLHKLTTTELAELSRWFPCAPGESGATPGPAAIAVSSTGAIAPSEPVVQETSPMAVTKEIVYPIDSRIVPPFTGWTGKTEFKLENGQTWRQRSKERHSYTGSDTQVTISKNFLGLYWLKMTATGAKVAVSRVK
jgi:hypothetical protein